MDSRTTDEYNIIHCPSGNSWIQTLEESIDQEKLVVSMYYASWSFPSKTMYDVMAQLSGIFPQVIFCKVDVDESKDITMRMAIRIVPTIILTWDGKELSRIKSVVTMEYLQEKISSSLVRAKESIIPVINK